MAFDDCKMSPIPGCPNYDKVYGNHVPNELGPRCMRYGNILDCPDSYAGQIPGVSQEAQKNATGEVCQDVAFTKTTTETIWSKAKPFGIGAGESYPMGTKNVVVTEEKEFCQDVYESDVFNASAQLQATINGYAQSNNYRIVSQRDVVFDPCDRSFFGDALLWIGGLFGSDAREISNEHCGKVPEAAARPATEEGTDRSFWEIMRRASGMMNEDYSSGS